TLHYKVRAQMKSNCGWLVLTIMGVAGQASAQAPTRAPLNLPDGAGKETVQAVCASCHSLNRLSSAGYSHQEWQLLLNSMVTLPKAQMDQVVNYLAANFPAKE